MKREWINPEDRDHWLQLRLADVTSTEASALFGISPYITHFELWHEKKSHKINDFASSERMMWGSRLEAAIAKGIAEDRDWKIRQVNRYCRAEGGLGSSFDFERVGDETAILEIKNVDGLQYAQQWEDTEAGIQGPPHIELQVQHQLLVSGREKAYIGVLIGGNRLEVLERDADPAVHLAIQKKVAEFWHSIERNTPPAPDYARDAKFVAKLYSYAEPGKIIESPVGVDALVDEYRGAGQQEKDAKSRKDAAKAQILEMIGDAEKVLGNGYSISAGLVGPSEVAYTRDGYRLFRVNKKKGKK